MNFLAPLFLAGGLAIALPIVFHLIRRTTRERKIFSSLMFLLPSPPRLTRRSRLEHILLLLLRCAVFCLLALAFARPFLKQEVSNDPPPAGAKRIVVLVDASASMRRANLWSDARDRVDAALRKVSLADQVALVIFGRTLTPVFTFEQWNAAPASERAALAMARLSAASPGWAGTHLGNALTGAAELLGDTGGKSETGPRQIVLVSDLQEGSKIDQLQGYEWPKGIELTVEQVKPRRAGNAGLQLVTDSNEAERKATVDVRVRVSNSADSKKEQFKVGWAQADGRSSLGIPLDVYVPPGQSRIVTLAAPAQNATVDRIILQGDDEDFDNTVFVIPPESARLNVLYLGSENEGEMRQPLYFLERAFQETRRQIVKVIAHKPTDALPTTEVDDATLCIVTDSLPEERARILHDRVAAGKTLLVAVKNPAGAPTLARLLGVDSIAVEEARMDNYAMLADIDFTHALFAPFADPRFSDFTKIHFWKYRRLDATKIPGARTIAKFDSGDPALVEVPVGKGRILILSSGWQPEESQLALSTKFVPLLYSALEMSGGAPPPTASYTVGETVPLAYLLGAEKNAVTIRGPDGGPSTLAAGETNFNQAVTPGIYNVVSVQPPKRFAVNLDASESRTTPMPIDELEKLGAPVSRQTPTVTREIARKVHLQNTELENRQKLWRWFIVAALVFLLIETWLAGRTARRLTVPEGATS